MAMTDSEVTKQLDNMVSFIKKEAEEKASEILVLAEEEFTLEKAKLVQSQKLKLIKEYERKEKQVDTGKKIIYSNELNRARLEKLRAQQKQVDAVTQAALAKLGDISNSPNYKDLLGKLMLQGLLQIDEAEVAVKCRAQDTDLVKSLFGSVGQQYQQLAGKGVKLSVSADKIEGAGGVYLSALEDRILCDNTLETRLHLAFDAALPKIRTTLFAGEEIL